MNFIVGGGITPGQAAPVSNMDELLKAEELALSNYKNRE